MYPLSNCKSKFGISNKPLNTSNRWFEAYDNIDTSLIQIENMRKALEKEYWNAKICLAIHIRKSKEWRGMNRTNGF